MKLSKYLQILSRILSGIYEEQYRLWYIIPIENKYVSQKGKKYEKI